MEHLEAARRGDDRAFRTLIAPFQKELRAYCYRMAGSLDDADDMLQESMLRAWRGLASFEGRSSVRTWLYRVTSSACLDALKGRAARKRAEDTRPPSRSGDPIPPPRPGEWIGPCPPAVYDLHPSAEVRYGAKESVAFAFLAALQLLPPTQRAALIACDVIGFSAEECADLLATSGTAVSSALSRARETIAKRSPHWQPQLPDDQAQALLARYVEAWERADAGALVALLHEDAKMSMPPLPIWIRGAREIGLSLDAMVFSQARPGDFITTPLEANGLPALGVYRRGSSGVAPYAIQVLELEGEAIRGFTAFLDTALFPIFGLAGRAERTDGR